MRSTYNDLERTAQQHGLTVQRNGRELRVLTSDAQELFSASTGQKLSGALAAINQYLQGSSVHTNTRYLPVTRTQTTTLLEGATLISRFYDREVPSEIPIRDPQQGTRLIEMFEDGGLLDAAVNKIVDSTIASSDGDDRGWVVSDTVDDRPVNPTVLAILDRLYVEVIGGANLLPAIKRLLKFGDAFCRVGIENKPQNLGCVGSLEWLPTYEIFRVEREVETEAGITKETYFEQRRNQIDEGFITIPYPLCVHWRFQWEGGKYGKALFSGKASYRHWQSLRDAEDDLKKATRGLGSGLTIHEHPEDASQEQIQAYRDEIEAARKRDGIISDLHIRNTGKVYGVPNLTSNLDDLASAINVWTKKLAVQSNVPLFLLGVETQGARDIAVQPVLSYYRFIQSFRADITTGIRHLCDLELLLHGIDPKDPANQYEILWPRIVLNPYESGQTDESDETQDIEVPAEAQAELDTAQGENVERWQKARQSFESRKLEDRAGLYRDIYQHQLDHFKHADSTRSPDSLTERIYSSR